MFHIGWPQGIWLALAALGSFGAVASISKNKMAWAALSVWVLEFWLLVAGGFFK